MGRTGFIAHSSAPIRTCSERTQACCSLMTEPWKAHHPIFSDSLLSQPGLCLTTERTWRLSFHCLLTTSSKVFQTSLRSSPVPTPRQEQSDSPCIHVQQSVSVRLNRVCCVTNIPTTSTAKHQRYISYSHYVSSMKLGALRSQVIMGPRNLG